MRKVAPTHPGEQLAELLEEMNITQYALAKAISVPPRRINEIVKGLRGITADTALRLGRYLGMSPQFWLNLQVNYELERVEVILADRLEHEVTPREVA
jgi:antitoxin HigA-1